MINIFVNSTRNIKKNEILKELLEILNVMKNRKCKLCVKRKWSQVKTKQNFFISELNHQAHNYAGHGNPRHADTRVHMQDNENFLSNWTVQCPHCSQGFDDRYLLRLHVTRDHADKFQYSCDICGKKFTSSSGCSDHRNTHFRQYTCHICEKVFKYRTNLTRHVKTQHVFT